MGKAPPTKYESFLMTFFFPKPNMKNSVYRKVLNLAMPLLSLCKIVHIRSYSALYFPTFGLNTKRKCGPEYLRIRALFPQYLYLH